MSILKYLTTGWLLCVLAAFPSGSALAAGADTGIQFREFAIQAGGQPDSLLVTVQLDYQLSDYLREGLLNGMTLESDISVDLEWHHSWWWNTRKPLLDIKRELSYHPLSRQYQVADPVTGDNWSFPTLIAALEQLGSLSDYLLPALPANASHNDAALFVDATLTPKTLYLPLKVQALFSDRYSLDSEGVMWPIP